MDDILKQIELFEHKYIFRGVPNKKYKMLPSLLRNDALNDYGNYYKEFLNNAVIKLSKVVKVDYLTSIEYLQHFDCKTNLLDFSNSFLVALYFACSDCFDEDGKVYVLDITKYNEYLKEINDPTCKFDVTSTNVMNYLIEYNNNGTISIDGIGIHNPIIVQPTLLFDRIRSQNGLFMLWGSNIDDLDTILKDVNDEKKIYQEIIIKKELKKDILNLLEKKYFITETSLMVNTEDINNKISELYSMDDYNKYKKRKENIYEEIIK